MLNLSQPSIITYSIAVKSSNGTLVDSDSELTEPRYDLQIDSNSCVFLSITVIAVNEAGDGKPGTINGSFLGGQESQCQGIYVLDVY